VLALLASGCVSGSKIRADSEIISAEIAQARRMGAMKCAPRELATAEAHLDFARAEVSQGASLRADDHVRAADVAIKKALELSKDCEPKKEPVVVKVAESDRDRDGIPDSVDRCPDDPEDYDGFQDDDGCPELDNDRDGVPDTLDRCPNTPGPAQNFGCPILDADGDGVPDDVDRCPNTPGPASNQGCPEPEKTYKSVVVKETRIEIKHQIRFKSGSAKIIGRQSFSILSEVAQALKDNPRIKRIRIEGHTDSVGGSAMNLRLSQNRANSVMNQLILNGVDPARMEAVGYGKKQPIASNATASGRSQNRRTEFNIIEQ
jgi:outer membrane protein OmpA-like peptidoglycan-associated protein